MQDVALQAPWGGYDLESPDFKLATNRARYLFNLLPGQPGKVTLRGPVRRPRSVDTAGAGAAITLAGGWVMGDKIAYASQVAGADDIMVADFGPAAPTKSAAVHPASFAAADSLYPMYTVGGNFCYGYTSGASLSNATNRRTTRGAEWSTDSRLVSWNGGTAAGDFVKYGAGHAPEGAHDLRVFLNRIWVLGGTEVGGSAVWSARLFWSGDLGDGTTVLADAAASWQTGGVTNEIILDDPANSGMGLAVINGKLIILRRRTIDVMTGTDPSNFSVRHAATVGCIDPGSILEWDDGVFFLSDTGIMFFDGAVARTVDGPVATEIQNYIAPLGSPNELNGVRLGNNYAMFTVTSTGISWILHVPTGSWTRFVGDGLTSGKSRLFQTTNYAILHNNGYMFDGSLIALPVATDISAGDAGHDVLGNGTAAAIRAYVYYRTLRLSAPGERSALVRLIMDYALKAAPGVSTGTIEWDGAILDAPTALTAYPVVGGQVFLESGLVFAGEYADATEPSTYRTIPPHRLSHQNEAVRSESLDVVVFMTLNVTSPAWPQYAELYDSVLTVDGPGAWRGA